MIDWIAKIHNAIEGLKQETLHICVNIIDYVILHQQIKYPFVHCLGPTALLIASKFEDIDQPTAQFLSHMSQLIQISKNFSLLRISEPITADLIKKLETQTLICIDFDLQFPSSRRFFEVYSNFVNASKIHRLFGEFILDITLLEVDMLKIYKPSKLALAALYLVSLRLSFYRPASSI